MNRVDRLFDILLHLRRKGRIRAEDLAQIFDVTVRTVYRDIAALHEMGVPIVSLPGEGYELMPGFYLPPLIFTPEEATALSLGARLLMRQAEGDLPDHAEKALTKIAAILPTATREHVDALNAVIDFFALGRRYNFESPQLLTLIHAIQQKQVVRLSYHGRRTDELTEREVEPSLLSYFNGTSYLSGYCRLRQGERSFRLDRIESLRVLDEIFIPRKSMPDGSSVDVVTIHLRVKATAVRWVRERQHYGFVRDETLENGDVEMIYTIEDLFEIKAWLLGWGAQVEVVSPTKAREAIRAEVQKMLNILT
ncbi:MAG: YafY family protein [Aggregatilineales bacterium]